LVFETLILDFPSHIAVAIEERWDMGGAYYPHEGEKYFYIETTHSGWGIGEIPPELDGVPVDFYEVR
jgi:hypothetical protein